MQGFDYSSNNIYFVTICVKDRKCCFGEIVGTARELSVQDFNHNSNDSNHNKKESNFKMVLSKYGSIVQDRLQWLSSQYLYVEIHNFVIMPNHVHAVIEIDSLKTQNNEVKIKSLSSLMGAFKTTSSKSIHKIGFLDFAWQRSFHDHIIRNEKSYKNIMNYIDLNPEKWHQDSFFINR